MSDDENAAVRRVPLERVGEKTLERTEAPPREDEEKRIHPRRPLPLPPDPGSGDKSSSPGD